MSLAEIADLVPCVLALRADEPVPAGPSAVLVEWIPAVRAASFSAKNAVLKRESLPFSHRCPLYSFLAARWTIGCTGN